MADILKSDNKVLNTDNFKALWEAIDEKFARKNDLTIPTRTVFVYKTGKNYKPGEKPMPPIGGSWNFKTNKVDDFELPINHPEDPIQVDSWGNADNIERPIWMSTKTFAAEPGAQSVWSEPTLISGENGSPGADGTLTEFVYKLSQYEWDKPGGSDPDYANNLPSLQENGYCPDGWTPSPSGIDETNQCEWQLVRQKQEDGSWGKWMGPSLWSKYGVNGQDGDGVEYI